MNTFLPLALLGFCTICQISFGAPDPITNLADELSTSHTWGNGSYPIIQLPKTAKPEEVIAAQFSKTTDPKGKIKDFEIEMGELSCCGNCGDKLNTKRLPSESWTSSLYCWRCDSITVMFHADRMSGDCKYSFEVYSGTK
jgi:hypothetical protein